jgi:hypothetical protein
MDSLIINQVKTLGLGTSGYLAGTSGPVGGLYTTQTQTQLSNNGYGIIRSGNKDVDSDNDGMPDYWELATGSNINTDDAMQIGSNGYTLIENYINWLGDLHATTYINTTIDIDLSKLAGGFTNMSPVYSTATALNGTAILLADNHTVRFTPTSDLSGIGSFHFTVNGSDNTSYTDTVRIAISRIKPTAINELKNKINIYPNPAANQIFVQIISDFKYEVYDALGKMALRGQSNQSGDNQKIDISKLNNGVYTLKITNNNVKTAYQFIKKK